MVATTTSPARAAGAIEHAALPGTGDLVAMETAKLRKRIMAKIVFALGSLGIAGFMIIAYLVTRFSTYDSPAERAADLEAFLLPGVIPDLFQVIGQVSMLLAVIVGAGLIGSEYGWNTMRVLVGSGVSRTRLIAAKIAVLALATVALVAAGFVATSLVSLGIGLVDGHGLTLSWLDARYAADIGLMFLRTIFTIFVPAALAFAVASLSRSLAAGIASGIGLLIVEPIVGLLATSLGSFGDVVNQALITTNVNAIQALNTFGAPREIENAPDAWQAAAVLALYAVALLGSAIIVFRRRDITSG
jgi:ABC-type transport system involved in multi-copper enzyme maturation permease subunit